MLPHSSKTFLSQVSSLDFLASHGFNFNKLVYESCRYVSITDYANNMHEKKSNEQIVAMLEGKEEV